MYNNNLRIKIIILVSSIVIFFGSLYFYNLHVVQDRAHLCAVVEKYRVCFTEDVLFYNEYEDIHYFPLDETYENKEMIFTISNKNHLRKYYLNDKKFNNNKIKVNYNEKIVFEEKASDNNYITKIKFTKVPIISINSNEEILNDYVNTKFELIDVFTTSKKNTITNLNANMRIRGNSSRIFDKKGYRLEFTNKKYTKTRNVSLLDMYDDDDWVLLSLYTDEAKIRNTLAFDMWNEISDQSLNGRFVELYINGDYRGLYDLREPINRKKLNLAKTTSKNSGILIKDTDWRSNNFEFDEAALIGELHGTFEIKYPNDPSLYPTYYKNILPKIKYFYEPVFTYDDLDENFNLENIVDFMIYIELIQGVDNISYGASKNVLFSMKNLEDKVSLVPWDLELSFGITWDGESSILSKKIPTEEYLLTPIKEVKDEKLKKYIKERYYYIRKTIDNQWLSDKILNYNQLLNESSIRDSNKWYEYDLEKETLYIENWFENRLELLDDFMEGY